MLRLNMRGNFLLKERCDALLYLCSSPEDLFHGQSVNPIMRVADVVVIREDIMLRKHVKAFSMKHPVATHKDREWGWVNSRE